MGDSPSAVSEVIDILVDVSESMGWNLNDKEAQPGDVTKFDLIRTALANGVVPTVRDDIAFGLKYFGGDCKPRTIVKPGLGQAATIRQRLAEIEMPNGKTPLAAVLRISLEDLMPYADISKKMLIFTDGEETCESKEALDDVIARLKQYNFEFRRAPLVIHAIAVGNVTPAVTETLHRIISATPGGTVREVPTVEDASVFQANVVDVAKEAIDKPAAAKPKENGIGRSSPLGKNSLPREERGAIASLAVLQKYLQCLIIIQVLSLIAAVYVIAKMPTRQELVSLSDKLGTVPEPRPVISLQELHDKLDIQAEALKSLSAAVKALKEPASKSPGSRGR